MLHAIAAFIASIFALFGLTFGHVNTAPLPPVPDNNVQVVQQTNTQATRAIPTDQTSITSQNTVSVPGMSKYTDADFGFSFWYPSGWTVIKEDMASVPDYSDGEHFAVRLVIAPPGYNPKVFGPSISVTEINSPTRSVISTGHFNSNTFSFDTDTHTWMEKRTNADGANSMKAADVSHNTMGGLHIFTGANEPEQIVPLSAQHFLSVGASGIAPTVDEMPFVKTILATDPSVATPVSAAEQIKTIQAEKDAYAGQ